MREPWSYGELRIDGSWQAVDGTWLRYDDVACSAYVNARDGRRLYRAHGFHPEGWHTPHFVFDDVPDIRVAHEPRSPWRYEPSDWAIGASDG